MVKIVEIVNGLPHHILARRIKIQYIVEKMPHVMQLQALRDIWHIVDYEWIDDSGNDMTYFWNCLKMDQKVTYI
jgi:hypothetical protein